MIDINEVTATLVAEAEAARAQSEELLLRVEELLKRQNNVDRARRSKARDLRYQKIHRISMSISVEEAAAIEAFVRLARSKRVEPDGVTEHFRLKLCRYLRKKEKARAEVAAEDKVEDEKYIPKETV